MPPARGATVDLKVGSKSRKALNSEKNLASRANSLVALCANARGNESASALGVCKTKLGLVKRYGLGQKRGTGEQQGLSEEQTASYQGAFEAVLAVPIAAGIGYWCDGRFDSAPIGVLIGVGIGFFAMMLRIVRMRPEETAGPTDPSEPAEQSEPTTESSSTADRPESDREESDR